MAGIGETLRVERRKQARTLADAAAETRVREAYLQALETEDFDALGGDVYVRGFIRLYARYLGLDAEALVETYRTEHEKAEEITAIPGATIDDILPPVGVSRVQQTPVLAAVGIVLLLVALFIFGRSRGNSPDEDSAPGPAPTEVATDADGAPIDPLATGAPTEQATIPPGQFAPPEDAVPLTRPVTVEVLPIREIRMRVIDGQPFVDATLGEGQGRVITGEAQVVIQVGDATAADIRVNGQSLVNLEEEFGGLAVEISCVAGNIGCDVSRV